MIHFEQIMNVGKFSKFDYGPEKNLDIYGNITPDIYNLENIHHPDVFLIVGTRDKLAHPLDSQLI